MKELKRLFQAARHGVEQANAYVAEHRVSKEYRFSEGFTIEEFKGLLFCQLITEESDERKVVSYWMNRDSYEANAGPFKGMLGGAEATGSGFYCEIKTKHVPPWRRVSILSTILLITTILGFWKTITDQFEEWFEPPELEISSEEVGPFHIAANANSEVQLSFRNRSLSTRATVGGIRCFLRDDRTNWPVFHSTQIVAMEKGETIKQRIFLKIPEPGSYIVQAEATIKTGKLRTKRTHTNAFPILVWPNFGFERARIQRFSSNRCSMVIDLISGTGANQLKCEAILTNFDDTCFDAVIPADKDPEIYCDKFSKRAAIDWSTRSLAPFKTRPFTLFLKSERPTSGEQWTNLIKRIEFKAVSYPRND